MEVDDGALGSNPHAVGAIDGTSNKVDSGHRHFHCFHTVLKVDYKVNLCYIHSRFSGHINDALRFCKLPKIGPNTNLEFPDDCHLLAGLGYHRRYSLMTPHRRLQIARAPSCDRRKYKKVNRIIRTCRVLVDHLIRETQIMRIV